MTIVHFARVCCTLLLAPFVLATAVAGDELKFVSLEHTAYAAEATEDGRFLVIAYQDANKISIFDIKKAEVVRTIHVIEPSAVVSRGQRLFVANYKKGSILELRQDRDWEIYEEFLVGDGWICHLSAARGKFFDGRLIIAIDRWGKGRFIKAVDTKKDAWKVLVSNPRDSIGAELDYRGKSIFVFGTNFVTYDPKNGRQTLRRSGIKNDRGKVARQSPTSELWYSGYNVLSPNLSLAHGGASRKTMGCFPDQTKPIFYEMKNVAPGKFKLTAYTAESKPTKLGERMLEYPERYPKPEPPLRQWSSRRDTVPYYFASTIDGRLYIGQLGRFWTSTEPFKLPPGLEAKLKP